jgi:O-antigen/teichoic acid export membrane protein
MKLGVGQGVSMACTFLRSVIIARLVSPENFGIAAILAMTYYLAEMGSSLGLETRLIQAEDGNDQTFQKSAQFLQACRGLLNASLTFSLAGLLSLLFGVPQAEWAFRCLALVQLIKGFTHFDQYRFQREMRFGPAVRVDVAGSILSLMATLVLVWWLRDYSAMVWILLVQAAATVLGSHLVAQRQYGWTWSLPHAKQVFSFGWPLTVNGLLMYGIFQGDQFVIGSAQRLFPQSTLTLSDLAVYSVAFSITMAPTTLIANLSTSMLLPLLSRVQEHRDLFVQRYLTYTKGLALIAALISILFILAGGWLVDLIYGAKYKSASEFIGWLAAMQSLRIIRIVPTIASIAQGNTVVTMLANIVRTSALLGVLVVTAAELGLAWIAAAGFIGEFLAIVFLSRMLFRQHMINPTLCLKPVGVALVAMAVAVLAARGGITTVALTGLVVVGVFHRSFKDMFFQLKASFMDQEGKGSRPLEKEATLSRVRLISEE